MKLRRNNISVYIATLGIVLGGLFLCYEYFVDGILFNRVDEIREPIILDPFDKIPFSIGATGEIIDGYQVRTDKPEYQVGDTVYIVMTFCHRRDLQAITQWTFLNSEITTLVAKKPMEVLKKDCYSDKKIEVGKIPPSLALTKTGTLYQLRGAITYAVNPLKKISYLLLSNSFTIRH